MVGRPGRTGPGWAVQGSLDMHTKHQMSGSVPRELPELSQQQPGLQVEEGGFQLDTPQGRTARLSSPGWGWEPTRASVAVYPRSTKQLPPGPSIGQRTCGNSANPLNMVALWS